MRRKRSPVQDAQVVEHPSARMGARRIGLTGALTATDNLRVGLKALALQLRGISDALVMRDCRIDDIAQNCADHQAFQADCLDALALEDIEAMALRRDELVSRFRRMHDLSSA